MKTIVQISTCCNTSPGVIMQMLQRKAVKEGYRSICVFGRNDVIPEGEYIRTGNRFDVYSHVALTRIFDRHGFGSRYATIRMIEQLKIIGPDMIHLHNIHGYYINVEILFEYVKENNIPVVWTLHDCWAFTGHCSYFDFTGCAKWKNGCFRCPQKRSYPSSILIDDSRNNYKNKKRIFSKVRNMTIVTPSSWLAELVKQSFLKEHPVKVINNGIDLDIFKPAESCLREILNIKSKFIILGVASVWDKRKGFDYFLEMSKKIKADEIIVTVGLTENQIKMLPSNVIGITRTNSAEELAKIYSAADVFINPTQEDNFPTTNLEALACGIPVITFNTGGSAECLDDSCGIVVERGNINELINAIAKLKEKRINKDACIRRSRLYDKNDRYADYMNLYEEILDDIQN